MGTIDLTNDITPQHQFRPVRNSISDIKDAILEATDAYDEEYLDRCTRNDLIYILRLEGVDFPFPFEPEEVIEG